MEPKVRFKGFEGEWRRIKFGTISSRITRRNNTLECKLPLTISANEGLISQEKFFKNIVASSNLGNYYLLKRGEFAYNKSYSNGYPFGAIKRLDKYDSGVLSPLYICFGIHDEVDSDYICFFFETTLWHKDVAERATEGARNHGILNIGTEDFFDIDIMIPESKEEQQAIASFFRILDAKLQASAKKLESLKKLKSASLVAMFPQNGESTSKVRFKGFEGEWKETTLSECLDISYLQNSENKYDKNDVLSVSDDFGVMNQIELLGRSYAGKDVSSYSILQKGEIVYTKSPLKDKPFGIIKKNSYQTGIVSILYAVYHSKDNISADYIHYYFDPAWRLNAYMRPLVNKGAKNTMNISDEMALMGSLIIPPSLAEQQAIAAYFRSLDRKIALETARLEKLKQIKLACLDKMFV